MFKTYSLGIAEFQYAITRWRVSHLMGSNQLRSRYLRSRIGQFWVTITTLITIIALGIVWAYLWRSPVAEFLPYVGTSQIVWVLVAVTVNECTGTIQANSNYFLNDRMSFTGVLLSVIWRNFLIFSHNIAAILAIYLWFRWSVDWTLLLAIPGLILCLLFLVLVTHVVSFVCTRFRDMVQITNNIMQIAFFLTPIMWQPEYLPEEYRWVILLNPFSSYLAIVRDPILGRPIMIENWLIAVGCILFLAIITPYIVGKWRNRVIYWI